MDGLNVWIHTTSSFKAQMIGKLLGDGCLTQQKGRKPRFQFIHTANDYGWSLHCYNNLKLYLPLNPPKYRKIADSRLINGFSLSHYTQSRTSTLVTFLRELWYPNSKKIVPFELLYEFFTAEALAWWYMDDGHLKYQDKKPLKIILSTESFSKLENEKLIAMLLEKYYLKFRVDKQNRILLYDQYQIRYFLYLVNPYMHISMHRKMISEFNLPKMNVARRTSIHLPIDIILKKPTADINRVLTHLHKVIDIYKQGDFYRIYRNRIEQQIIETRSYQIVISSTNLNNLNFLNEATGLSMSFLTDLVIQTERES